VIRSLTSRGKSLVLGTAGKWVAGRQPTRADLPHSLWGIDVGPDGTLHRDGVRLVDLVERFGSPLHVVSGAALQHRADEALAPFRHGRGADVFYSYKTNPVPGVLARLHANGVGAEVISAFELWLALRLGVPADRIIYNGPAKSPESLRVAVEHGVRMINVNSMGEIATIAGIAAVVGRPARIGIRISLPYMWGGQFGLAGESARTIDAVESAIASPHVHLLGIHFHCGFPLRSADDMSAHVNRALDFCGTVRDATGWFPDHVDLGGSLTTATVEHIPRVQYRLNRALKSDLLPPDTTTCLSVGQAAGLAHQIVAERCAALGANMPELVLEPGRGLTGDTQMLLTTVVDVKDDRDPVHAVLDAGMNIAEPTKDEYHQLFSVTAPQSEAVTSYRLVGPICTPADVLYTNWRLPELQPGHVLAIMDTGAYYVPFSTSFSFPRPGVVVQDGADVSVMRRPESFEDIVSLDGDAMRHDC
jgi:diaminopimelate decarboxylase